jgi:hypothetical protein
MEYADGVKSKYSDKILSSATLFIVYRRWAGKIRAPDLRSESRRIAAWAVARPWLKIICISMV